MNILIQKAKVVDPGGKYHNKTRYRVRRGHRQIMTEVLIKDIENSISTKKVKTSSKKQTKKTTKTGN